MLRLKAAQHSEEIFGLLARGSSQRSFNRLDESGKNNVVLETIALGMIALDSDNEAGYGNVDYNNARENFEDRLKCSRIRICMLLRKTKSIQRHEKMCAEKLHALKLRHDMN